MDADKNAAKELQAQLQKQVSDLTAKVQQLEYANTQLVEQLSASEQKEQCDPETCPPEELPPEDDQPDCGE